MINVRFRVEMDDSESGRIRFRPQIYWWFSAWRTVNTTRQYVAYHWLGLWFWPWGWALAIFGLEFRYSHGHGNYPRGLWFGPGGAPSEAWGWLIGRRAWRKFMAEHPAP